MPLCKYLSIKKKKKKSSLHWIHRVTNTRQTPIKQSNSRNTWQRNSSLKFILYVSIGRMQSLYFKLTRLRQINKLTWLSQRIHSNEFAYSMTLNRVLNNVSIRSDAKVNSQKLRIVAPEKHVLNFIKHLNFEIWNWIWDRLSDSIATLAIVFNKNCSISDSVETLA